MITHDFIKKLGRKAELSSKMFYNTITREEKNEYYELKEYFIRWFLR